jgi:hypothetical protein
MSVAHGIIAACRADQERKALALAKGDGWEMRAICDKFRVAIPQASASDALALAGRYRASGYEAAVYHDGVKWVGSTIQAARLAEFDLGGIF